MSMHRRKTASTRRYRLNPASFMRISGERQMRNTRAPTPYTGQYGPVRTPRSLYPQRYTTTSRNTSYAQPMNEYSMNDRKYRRMFA